MNRLALTLTLCASAAFAQVRVYTNVVDGGTKADAGVVVEAPKPLPAATLRNADPELERLHREVVELKSMVERQSAQLDALSTTLDKVGKQVSAVRTDLADAEQRRVDDKQKVLTHRADTATAMASVNWALEQLAQGSGNVGDALRTAENTFSGPALRAVQNARAALASNDLSAARTWLGIALSEAANARD
jgi:septal ring factor EnvC (AmiA/AmiB activator)